MGDYETLWDEAVGFLRGVLVPEHQRFAEKRLKDVLFILHGHTTDYQQQVASARKPKTPPASPAS